MPSPSPRREAVSVPALPAPSVSAKLVGVQALKGIEAANALSLPSARSCFRPGSAGPPSVSAKLVMCKP